MINAGILEVHELSHRISIFSVNYLSNAPHEQKIHCTPSFDHYSTAQNFTCDRDNPISSFGSSCNVITHNQQLQEEQEQEQQQVRLQTGKVLRDIVKTAIRSLRMLADGQLTTNARIVTAKL